MVPAYPRLIGPLHTDHRVFAASSTCMEAVADDSVQLVVTSPPYPMIGMWDGMFAEQDPAIERALADGRPDEAFGRMHRLLDPIWRECFRVLSPGGTACINIGDATRSLSGEFRLYPNHALILRGLLDLGFHALPDILWRKQTNAPNKFMGSGMLPAGAYVTLEHEYILIFRKPQRRDFSSSGQKRVRRESALFWEERNSWYSDVWTDLKGIGQELARGADRARSAAFPFEMAYRLISMFSVKGDLVLDPFLGTGTTTLACMATGRHSLGFEIDAGLTDELDRSAAALPAFARDHLSGRLARHRAFVDAREATAGPLKYANKHHGFPVVTNQETDLLLRQVADVQRVGTGQYSASYDTTPAS